MIDPREIPSADASWRELEAFCQTIAGPEGDPRSIDELAAIARQVEADPSAATVDALLTAIYFDWRRARWTGTDAEGIRAIRITLDKLRRRLATPAGLDTSRRTE